MGPARGGPCWHPAARGSWWWWGEGCQPGHAGRPGQLMVALLTVTTWALTMEAVRAQSPQGSQHSGISGGTTVLSRGTRRSARPGDKVQCVCTELHPAALGCRRRAEVTRKSFPRGKLLPLFLPAPVSVCTQPFPQNNSGRSTPIPRSCERATADRTSPSASIYNPLPVSANCHCSFNSPSHRPPGFAVRPARRNSTFRRAVLSRAGLGRAGLS